MSASEQGVRRVTEPHGACAGDIALARLPPVVMRRTRMHTVTTPDDLKIFVEDWAK